MAENNIKLLPCPLCGSEAKLWGYSVQCSTERCFVSNGTRVNYKKQEDAIAAWNKRSAADAVSVVEAMQLEEPNVYFMDGNTLNGKEAWKKCLRAVLERLQSS